MGGTFHGEVALSMQGWHFPRGGGCGGHFPWGWHISRRGDASVGGGISLGGLTLVFNWLMASGVTSMGGGVKQRSHCWQNHWSSNTTSRLFKR